MDNPRSFSEFQGLVVALGIFFLHSTADCATLRVPQDYQSITAAANVAQGGDSILVWRGPSIDYWNEQINLRQGVVLRGMEPIYPSTEMWIYNSVINLLESSPSSGVDDTTRVEHFAISNPLYHETIQIYTPRSSLVECVLLTSGPQDWTMVRVWKGGVIARNYLTGNGDSNAIEARQGAIVVSGNVFEGLLISFRLDNQGAADPAMLTLRSNTINGSGPFFIYLRPDSNGELVNNIFHSSGWVDCMGTVDIRFNDFHLTYTSCSLGTGNISEDPQFCTEVTNWLDPDSPCIGAGEGGTTMGAGGICGVTSVGGEASPAPPNRFHLTVDPNPVSSTAEFTFEAGIEDPMLEIFDPQGRLIDLLHPLGQRVRWNPAGSMPRGIYFARLRGAGVSETVKFLVIK